MATSKITTSHSQVVFDAPERDLCSDGYGAVLHLTYFKWNGSSWVPATADPIKVTTGAYDTVSRSWTFKDVRDVKVYSYLLLRVVP